MEFFRVPHPNKKIRAMKTTTTKKMSFLVTALALASLVGTRFVDDGTWQAVMENELIRKIKAKLETYENHLPEDRIYLQTDKPFYQPGEDIWLTALVREGSSLKASSKSDIVHVELISPKGSVEKKISLIGKNGKAMGDFSLDADLNGGLYKLRAYTEWMRNEGENRCFEKEIQVQQVILPKLKMKLDFEKKAYGAGDEVVAILNVSTNENKALEKQAFTFVAQLNGTKLVEKADLTESGGIRYIRFQLPKNLSTTDGLLNVMIQHEGSTESISRSIPLLLNQVKLDFFPEGGDLVANLDSRVAFRALNEFGKPADVEGKIVDRQGNLVTTFSSFHQGMGAFNLKATAGVKYQAVITKPAGITSTYALPEIQERGYVMNLDNTKNGEIGVTVRSSENEQLALVAQVRGKMYYSTLIQCINGQKEFRFSTETFPMGVAQLTLFDSKGIARAERLVFVNKHKQLNISVSFEKEKFLPREKVKMTLSVKDERGLPMPANLCVSVVNDQLLSFADNKAGNILSELLLQQDLKEKVEEPAFYFDKKEKKADQALDYLLMTSGWRRFTWEQLLEENLPQITYTGQKTIFSGKVINAEDNTVLKNVKLKSNQGREYVLNEQGEFKITDLDLSSPFQITCSADGFFPQVVNVQDYEQNKTIYLYKVHQHYYINGKRKMVGRLENEAEEDQIPMAMEAMEAAPVAVFNEQKHVAAIKSIKGVQKDQHQAVAVKEIAAGEKGNAGVAMVEDLRAAGFAKRADLLGVAEPVQNKYYRARQFPVARYEQTAKVETRTDFKNTIYWNPDVQIGYSGKKTLEFYTCDDITSYRATVEAINQQGEVGRTEQTLFTQLPFTLSTKIPVEVATEDKVSIPLTLKNNSTEPLGGVLNIKAPEGLIAVGTTPSVQTIMPGSSKTIYLDYVVSQSLGEGEFSVSFKSCGLSDAFTQKIQIVPKGFPVKTSFSGQDLESVYEFTVHNAVTGSLKASFTAFPNVVSDLMTGIEGILQEPYGCFEQTSCTAYPNAMVLDYLKNTDSKNDAALARASDLLNRGYKRLTTFETPNKGYEWFGASPAHEGLTAYGIMEFVDMQKAGQNIDQTMLDRTALWLLNHRDGQGGFQREQRALHDFGRISEEVMNGYIVYALAEAGYTTMRKEFETTYAKAMGSNDAYLLAMAANAAFALNETQKGQDALKPLLAKQEENGSIKGATHSITYSQGTSLTIETTALSVLAILKSKDKNMNALSKAIQYLVSARSGSGAFSSTQGTILALKALTAYAKFSKRTSEGGVIAIYVDNQKVTEKRFEAGEQGAITISGLEKFVKGEGKHSIKVKYLGVKTALPYSIAVNWNTFLPNSDKDCSIGLSTSLSTKTVNVGETVRLTVSLNNKQTAEVPSTMAIIGIPAGLSVQPWQLKELQEKNVFDYYEIKGNNLALYYRGLAGAAKKEIKLDLKAELPGEYDAPASSAYLYYTNELKTWNALERIVIRKSASNR